MTKVLLNGIFLPYFLARIKQKIKFEPGLTKELKLFPRDILHRVILF